MQKTIFILLFLVTNITFGQIKQSKANLDYACFILNKDTIEIELYFEISSKDIKYYPNDSINYKSRLNFVFNIKNLTDSIKEDIKWDYDTYNNINELKKELQVIGIKKFVLKTNTLYNINIELKNENNILKTSNFNVIKNIDTKSKFNLSNIEFAYDIKSNSKEFKYGKNYFKNKIEIIPNPSSEYYGNDAELKFYFEIKKNDTISKIQNIKYEILNGANKAISEFEYKLIYQKSDIIPEYRSLPLFDMTTGIYITFLIN